jgi:hypothetical protein
MTENPCRSTKACTFKHGWPKEGVEVSDIFTDKMIKLGS